MGLIDGDAEVQGRYFNGTREAEPDPLARDADARRRLWDVSVELTRPTTVP